MSLPLLGAGPAAGGADPIVANQSIDFGALTLEGAGAKIVTNTGGGIASVVIDSGDADSHWTFEISGGAAYLVPTAQGDTDDLDNTPYSLACTFTGTNGGEDTATITVTCSGNDSNGRALGSAYSVASYAELIAAIAAAETASASGDYHCIIRDGTDIANGGDYIKLYGYEFSGTLSDANDGAAETAYDFDAVASFSSGSFHISSETDYSAQFSDRVRILGSTGIVISGMRFTAVPSSDSYNRDDGGAGTDTSAATALYQLLIEKNGTYTAEPLVIIADNQFGGNAVNANGLRWGQAARVDIADQAIFEDNSFDGFYIGLTFASVNRGVARRNTFQNQLVDAIRGLGNATADLGSFTLERLEITSNKIWNPLTSADWAGAHADGIQFGTSADQVDYSIFVKKNYIYLPTEAISHPSYSNQRTTQGIYLDDTTGGVTIDGVIAENFVCCTASAAIALWAGTVTVRDNTLINDTLHAAPTGNSSRNAYIRVRAGTDHDLDYNISSGANDEGGTFTDNNGADLDATLSSGAASYPSNFDGVSSGGTYGPTWTVRTDTAANLVTDIDSSFTPTTSSSAENKGHLESHTAAPTFSGNATDPILWFDLSADAGNIPANTSKITIRFTNLVQTNPATAQQLVNATSTTFDVEVKDGDGSLYATVEDSGGNKALTAADLGVNLTASTAQTIVLCASLPDDKFWVTIDGTPTEVAMTDTANELFTTARYFTFFATAAGAENLDYTCEKIELWYSASADPSDGSVPAGDPDWSVTGPQATAEADTNAVTT